MAIVAIEGMQFFAYHGLHEEERIIGTQFILDAYIQTEMKDVKIVIENEVEQVSGSINYALVYDICRIQMQKPQKLLEHLIGNMEVWNDLMQERPVQRVARGD